MHTRLARLYGKHDLKVESQAVAAPGEGQVLLRMAAAGICGSDLHYYQDGGIGTIRVVEPIIPGHEAAGYIEAVGPGVTSVATGQLVAVNPSRPCGQCLYCKQGLPIHCMTMRFMGSAMRVPHEQGMFRDWLVVPAIQCIAVSGQATAAEAACAEPLAVCLHAVSRAPDLVDKAVLVTGAGPIGALVVAAARHAGAGKIVVTDLMQATLDRATAMGADMAVLANAPEALKAYEGDKGQFDVVFECSAAGPALRSAIATVKPRGTIVQVGVAGDMVIPLNALVGKEINFIGSQRFDAEFATAVALIASRRIDVRPIISHTFPLADAVAAFEQAGDRSTACKVQLSFSH